jgi:hypothetical protein
MGLVGVSSVFVITPMPVVRSISPSVAVILIGHTETISISVNLLAD